jgi:hypothetical protein
MMVNPIMAARAARLGPHRAGMAASSAGSLSKAGLQRHTPEACRSTSRTERRSCGQRRPVYVGWVNAEYGHDLSETYVPLAERPAGFDLLPGQSTSRRGSPLADRPCRPGRISPAARWPNALLPHELESYFSVASRFERGSALNLADRRDR